MMPPDIAFPAAFWRGVTDGDGHLGLWPASTVSSGVYPMLELCGTKPMMEQFLEWAISEYPFIFIGSEVQRQGTIYKVTCTGSTAAAIIEILYAGAPPALPRKLEQARAISAWAAQTTDRSCGEHHYAAVLTTADFLEIRRMRDTNQATERELAQRFGVARATIGLVALRKSWRHVPEAVDDQAAPQPLPTLPKPTTNEG